LNLQRASVDDAWSAKRETLRFSVGSGMTWVGGDRAVSHASSAGGDVVVLFKVGRCTFRSEQGPVK